MSESAHLNKRSIGDLVRENYVFAGVLHYFGISFYRYEQKSLAEVCQQFRINPQQLIQELENWAMRKEPSSEEFYLRPIEVLVAYLKKKHHFFLRHELPFLSSMIDGIPANGGYADLLSDMKLVFPLFVDDFIHHIHEEESTLFKRIKMLQEVENNQYRLDEGLKILSQPSIVNLAEEHEVHDDEMEGIRKLTNGYMLSEEAPMAIQVLYHELQHFENELVIHAKIENDLLFPKAIELEKEVKRKLTNKIRLN
ncbi:hemerythrin HHE cation-binding protein [Echinicola jeungdonensis]|uniref:Hemerythrin HHE cation-binding protein n=1 Tax=Echinicola jeungdonensis TaxID=709343 RepID=A0ABV5J9D1_9BACT|nr:hemerythrin HHE cation-binding protein [Echinicola jeungdonensis]MDN3669642.1 hemerythrin HHE cation-binding protein [Echinicola jeungdonensis]